MGWFMGREHLQNLDVNRGHEPGRANLQVCPTKFMESLHLPSTCIGTLNRTGVGTARPHDDCGDEPSQPRFMEREHLPKSDVNRGHEPFGARVWSPAFRRSGTSDRLKAELQTRRFMERIPRKKVSRIEPMNPLGW